ncbi:MAG: hypothetical protein WC659_06450 [Patescibacteria group bacterium]
MHKKDKVEIFESPEGETLGYVNGQAALITTQAKYIPVGDTFYTGRYRVIEGKWVDEGISA